MTLMEMNSCSKRGEVAALAQNRVTKQARRTIAAADGDVRDLKQTGVRNARLPRGQAIMSKKAQQANFEQALEILRASGFETAPYASVPGGVLASREGVGAVLVAGEEVARIAVGAGRMIGGELSRLVDRGYQKFLKTSRFELPARASDLHAIHAFDEDLKQLTGAESLFNESMGTTSDRYQYDRVKGRAAASALGARPWDTATGH
jgi:hypothetical protein